MSACREKRGFGVSTWQKKRVGFVLASREERVVVVSTRWKERVFVSAWYGERVADKALRGEERVCGLVPPCWLVCVFYLATCRQLRAPYVITK